jgi:hypothetical protein
LVTHRLHREQMQWHFCWWLAVIDILYRSCSVLMKFGAYMAD